MSRNGVVFGILAVLAVLLCNPLAAQEWMRSPREIQQALTDKGYDPGGIDGIWGKRSAAALKAFQKSIGVAETGVLSRLTAAQLFPPSSSAPNQPAPDVVERKPLPATSNPVPAAKSSSDEASFEGAVAKAIEGAPAVAKPQPTPTGPTGAKAPENAAATVVSTGGGTAVFGTAPPPASSSAVGQSRNDAPTSTVPVGHDNGVLSSPRDSRPEATSPSTSTSQRPTAPSVTDVPTSSARTSPSSGSFWKFVIDGALIIFLLKLLGKRKKKTSTRVTAKATSRSEPADTAQRKAELAIPVERKPQPARSYKVSRASSERIAAQNAAVTKALVDRAQSVQASQTGQEPHVQFSPAFVSGKSGWIPAGTAVKVGNQMIPGGMIYVGGSLPKRNASHEDENCLINPRLLIGRRGDPDGATMGYWPSYSRLTPEARKSYLDWLAGPRSDPATNIGYVFLYFYGLERRLMLEADVPDAAALFAEVQRLLEIYGANGSFNRYAKALLGACELKLGGTDHTQALAYADNGYDVPITVKIALGIRLESGTPVEPDLLLAYVRDHPETQVRTPARRVDPALLKRMFADEVERRYPKGVRITGKSGRKLTLGYHACSGSFDVEIKPFGLDLVDVTGRSEPISTGRDIFNGCVETLDDYSRALGRSEGLKPTLSAIAKLPPAYRAVEARRLEGDPLGRLDAWASSSGPVALPELIAAVGMPKDKPINKTALMELSSTLATFGFGQTGDPNFSVRTQKPDEPVHLFTIEGDGPAEATDGYREIQIQVILGLIVALADGELHALELKGLNDIIDAFPGLSSDERRRLKAEMRGHIDDPSRLSDFTRKIKDTPVAAREAIANALVAMAAADGVLHPDEVRQLEKLFRQMSLDPASLYARLHDGIATTPASEPEKVADDEPPMIIAPVAGASDTPIPPQPEPPVAKTKKHAVQVDVVRLRAIRQETSMAASVLADIFADDEDEPPTDFSDEEPKETGDDLFEGLERRYGSLLLEMRAKGEWAAEEFARLARDAGLMPAAIIEKLNDWSLDLFDELLLEGDDPVVVNLALLPTGTVSSDTNAAL